MTDAASPARRGSEFADEDVVRSYGRRAPYPPELIERLVALAPGRGRALDLGCGPGKLAIPLAETFGEVVAVDPSAPMIAAARAADAGRHGNIRWMQAFAEEAEFGDGLDLAVAGAAIHWMDPAILFPRLAEALEPAAPIAIVDGDGPAETPWFEAYKAVIVGWVERLGGRYNSPEFVAAARAHEAWIDIQGREDFLTPCDMRLEDLVEGEHSRATWSRSRMGAERAAAFDADLRSTLEPHARDGIVSFRSRTRLLWGRPRTSLRPSPAPPGAHP